MLKLVAASSLAVLATAAAAQVTSIESSTAQQPKRLTGDPDRIICEKIERLGSRLAVDKVCMTARQWQEHRDGHRADVEAVQRGTNMRPSN
jgi:hypothetical protein